MVEENKISDGPKKCGKCNAYDHRVKRCLLGKINPPTLKGAIHAEETCGPGYVCQYSKWHEKVRKAVTK